MVVQFFKDTRNLSEGARLLYAGSKATKDGMETKMYDQADARMAVAKHLGMMVNKHEVSGKDGAPIPIQIVEIVRPAPKAEQGPLPPK